MSFLISKPAAQPYLKMLIYGPYGAGKTTFASTAQDIEPMQNVIFIDAESGSLALSHRQDIDVIRITNYQQFARVHEFLRLHCQLRDRGDKKKLLELAQKANPDATEATEYRTVVIDSLTEVQKFVMYMLLGTNIDTANLEFPPETPQWAEWGQSAEMIRLLVRTFRDLPMHVIFVCSEQEKEDERKRIIRRPNLPGKLGGEVQGFLDIVGYLATARGGDEDEGLRRRLYITPGNTFQAKHRFFNAEEGYFDNPSMSDLWGLLQKNSALTK
jgi:hypothetical protein